LGVLPPKAEFSHAQPDNAARKQPTSAKRITRLSIEFQS